MNTYVRRASLGFAAFAAVLAAAFTVLAVNRPVSAQRPPTLFQIDASFEGWADTGTELAAGEQVAITVSGMAGWGQNVSAPATGGSDSDCVLTVPGAPVGALVARVGAGEPVVAAGATLTGPGAVTVLYNECPGQYFDNTGGFEVRLSVSAVPPATTGPAPAAASSPSHSGGFGSLPILAGLVGASLIALMFGRRYLARGPVGRFSESARLESSAWLAPVRLRSIQGERRPKRFLVVGGPDADVDFGLPKVTARLVPMVDGGVRVEGTVDDVRVTVDGMPVVLGQRLKNGSRVKIGTREFVYRFDVEPGSGHGESALSKIDPRAAALAEGPMRPMGRLGSRDVA
jgi:hypothetical protein